MLKVNKQIEIYLCYSNYYFEDINPIQIKNATIRLIRNDSVSISTSYYDTISKKYLFDTEISANFIKPNMAYTLKVEIPNKPIITASTTTPETTEISSTNYYPVTIDFFDYLHFVTNFNDNINTTNYYLFYTTDNGLYNNFISDDPLLDQHLFRETRCIFNDKIINGTPCNININYIDPRNIDSVNIHLCSLSKEAYLFFKSANDQVLQNNIPIDGIDIELRIGDISKLYSNIKNAYGYFGAINESTKTAYINNHNN